MWVRTRFLSGTRQLFYPVTWKIYCQFCWAVPLYDKSCDRTIKLVSFSMLFPFFHLFWMVSDKQTWWYKTTNKWRFPKSWGYPQSSSSRHWWPNYSLFQQENGDFGTPLKRNHHKIWRFCEMRLPLYKPNINHKIWKFPSETTIKYGGFPFTV